MSQPVQSPPDSPMPSSLPVALSPGMTVPDAVQRIIKQQSAILQEMLPVAYSGEDTEGVHKVRVSLRRLRTCLKVTQGYYQHLTLAATLIDLKFVREVFGRLRDMDVFHQNFAQRFTETHSNEDFSSAIWQPVFEQTYGDYLAQIRSHVTQDIINQLLQTLAEFQESESILGNPEKLAHLPKNIAAFLPIILNAQLEEILQFQLNQGEDRLYSGHHKLRLLFKAHRYTYEFFQSILEPEPSAIAIETLTRVQDHLGALNDSVQAIRLVSTHQSPRHTEFVSTSLREYIHSQEEQQKSILAAFPVIWSEFIAAGPQALMDGSIATLKS